MHCSVVCLIGCRRDHFLLLDSLLGSASPCSSPALKKVIWDFLSLNKIFLVFFFPRKNMNVLVNGTVLKL